MDVPTPVIQIISEQAKARIIGSVAVKDSCQTVLPDIHQSERIFASAHRQGVIRHACNAALMNKLLKASFPLSLLPATPLMPEKKEPRP